MDTAAELAITLSPALFAHLRAEAHRLDVALQWLVAALVADTRAAAAWPIRKRWMTSRRNQ